MKPPYTAILTTTAALIANVAAIELAITDDAYLEDGQRKNKAHLIVENDGRVRASYLKVDLSKLPAEIQDATLYLKQTISSNDPGGNGTIRLFHGISSSWSEGSLTPEKAPSKGELIGKVSGKFAPNQVVSFDLAKFLQSQSASGDNLSLVLELDGGGNDIWFDSSEGAVPPAVIVNDDGAGYQDGSSSSPDEGSGTPIGSGGIGEVYLEADGLVILEAESTQSPLGKWEKGSTLEGYTGDGYLTFTANNYETGPPNSPLEFTFRVQRAGLYHLHLHCAREDQQIRGEMRDDVANDAYVRVEGDFEAGPGPHNSHRDNASLTLLQNDTKFFGGDDDTFAWASEDRLDPGGKSNKRDAVYHFKAGENYRLTVSGRSKAFKLNRILFRHQEVAIPVAEDLKLPESQRVAAESDFLYTATKDFPRLKENAVPYYVDRRYQCLAIDASTVDYRKGFARASRVFQGVDGRYQVRITTHTEEDGESSYRILTNGQEAAPTFQNPFIGPGSDRDLKPHQHVWENVDLRNGDLLAIESNAATNGQIPEDGGTAWSRGRWQTLEFFLVNSLPEARTSFDKEKDLLLAQFDSKPDADDIHAQAALGSMLAHPDLAGVNCFAVAGAIGIQDGAYIDSTSLFNLAFGKKNQDWTDASGGDAHWKASVKRIRDRVRSTLKGGGTVWVQEAGQSDITRDWVAALIASGVSEELIQEKVIVVQHSPWNEKKTTTADLNYVRNKTDYHAIDDGNADLGDYSKRPHRGEKTPGYVSKAKKWLQLAQAADNPNPKARALWTEAVRIIDATGFKANYSEIPDGGVDFSDCVENWYIFEIGDSADTVGKFWKRYVVNTPVIKAPVN